MICITGGQPAPSTTNNPSSTNGTANSNSNTTSSSSTDFQPDRPIGYGAFGVVWSVTDPRDGKRVALKKLPNVFQSLVSSKRKGRKTGFILAKTLQNFRARRIWKFTDISGAACTSVIVPLFCIFNSEQHWNWYGTVLPVPTIPTNSI